MDSEKYREQDEGISRLVANLRGVAEGLSRLSHKHIDMVRKTLDGGSMAEEEEESNWHLYLTDMPEIIIQELEEALQVRRLSHIEESEQS